MQTLILKHRIGYIYIRSSRLHIEKIYYRSKETLHNDKRIDPSGRHSNPKCVHTKHQSLIIHEAKTDKAESRNGKVCNYSLRS